MQNCRLIFSIPKSFEKEQKIYMCRHKYSEGSEGSAISALAFILDRCSVRARLKPLPEQKQQQESISAGPKLCNNLRETG